MFCDWNEFYLSCYCQMYDSVLYVTIYIQYTQHLPTTRYLFK